MESLPGLFQGGVEPPHSEVLHTVISIAIRELQKSHPHSRKQNLAEIAITDVEAPRHRSVAQVITRKTCVNEYD